MGNGASACLWIGTRKKKGFADLQETLQYNDKGLLKDALSPLVRGLGFTPRMVFMASKLVKYDWRAAIIRFPT